AQPEGRTTARAPTGADAHLASGPAGVASAALARRSTAETAGGAASPRRTSRVDEATRIVDAAAQRHLVRGLVPAGGCPVVRRRPGRGRAALQRPGHAADLRVGAFALAGPRR